MNDTAKISVVGSVRLIPEDEWDAAALTSHRRDEAERRERSNVMLQSLHSGGSIENLRPTVLDRQFEIDDIADEMGM